MASFGGGMLLKNPHVEMKKSKNEKTQVVEYTEASTIATPLASMILQSPFAEMAMKLAETTAQGSALVMAVTLYVTRVMMDTMLGDNPAMQEMMASLGALQSV